MPLSLKVVEAPLVPIADVTSNNLRPPILPGLFASGHSLGIAGGVIQG